MDYNKENQARVMLRTALTASSLNDTTRIEATSRLTFRPGALSKSAVVGRSHLGSANSSSAISASDSRDLMKELDTLRKELERKETRNVNQTSEMQALRTSYSTLQREVRMLSGTFEKMNADRQRLSSELIKCKDYKDKLEVQLSRLGDAQHLASQAERFQNDKEQMEMELGNFRSLLAARDDRIKSLERDLEIFHRSLEIQSQYEGNVYSSRSGSSIGGGKESIKSLYYELGKRQTDAHSLAISLASSNQELVSVRDNLREAIDARSEALADLENLRQHFAHLSHQSVRDKDEIAAMHEKHNSANSLAHRLQAQVEDLSKRISEERLGFEKERAEQGRFVVEGGEALQKAQLEVKSLRGRVEQLQTQLSQADSVRTLTEKRLAAEWSKLSGEMESLAEKSRRYDLLEAQLETTRLRLAEALAAKEEAQAAVRALADGEALQMHNSALSLEVNQANARVSDLIRDKEQSVAALQQTMEAARDLNARLQAEKARRVSLEERVAAAEERAAQAERVAEGVNKAREHVSTAVLDALHKERVKSAALEKTLNDRGGDSASTQPPQPPPHAVASSSGSRTISDELLKLRNEIARMEAAAPQNLSSFSDSTDSSSPQGGSI